MVRGHLDLVVNFVLVESQFVSLVKKLRVGDDGGEVVTQIVRIELEARPSTEILSAATQRRWDSSSSRCIAANALPSSATSPLPLGVME